MATPLQIFESEGLWPWWLQNNGNGTWPFNGISEKGIDFSQAYGTPIGAIEGGQVIYVKHNNNAINDIVVIQGTDGYWLYQHITSSLQVGDTVSTGGIVGTQNGLPVTPGISTGSHIEVRYSPTYNLGIDSWLQDWINPKAVFSSVANSQDTSGIPLTSVNGSIQAMTLNSSNISQSNTQTGVPYSNVIGGFDFTRFIDAFLLASIAVVAIIVGALLMLNMGNSNQGSTGNTGASLEKVAELAAV